MVYLFRLRAIESNSGLAEINIELKYKCEGSVFCMNRYLGWGYCIEKDIFYIYLERIMVFRFILV